MGPPREPAPPGPTESAEAPNIPPEPPGRTESPDAAHTSARDPRSCVLPWPRWWVSRVELVRSPKGTPKAPLIPAGLASTITQRRPRNHTANAPGATTAPMHRAQPQPQCVGASISPMRLKQPQFQCPGATTAPMHPSQPDRRRRGSHSPKAPRRQQPFTWAWGSPCRTSGCPRGRSGADCRWDEV